MLYGQEFREATCAELGTTDPKVISKALGDKWGQVADKSKWEKLAAADKARFEKENAIYTAALEAEAEADRQSKAAAAAGPSDREVERAEKRARMDAEAAARQEKPKAPRKAKVLTAEEKELAAQNKEIMGDKQAAAKKRLQFLLGQSDLFKHFGIGRRPRASSRRRRGARRSARRTRR